MRSMAYAFMIGMRGALSRPYEVATLICSSFAMAVIVLAFLGMKAGLDRALANAGSDRLLVLLGNGAETEVTSALALSEVNRITTAARMSSTDDLIISPEVYTNIRTGDDNGRAEIIAIRGLMPAGFELRRNFSIVEGRRFDPGRRELLAGRELAARLPWINIGHELSIGDESWVVVGLFSADETAAESELVGGATLIQDAFRRQGIFQSVRVGKKNGDYVNDIINNINENLTGGTSLKIFLETEYYGSQISDINDFINFIAIPSIIILFFATAFSRPCGRICDKLTQAWMGCCAGG